jgi:hypothetical protein
MNLRPDKQLLPSSSLAGMFNQNYEEVLGYPACRLNFSAGMRFRIGGGK